MRIVIFRSFRFFYKMFLQQKADVFALGMRMPLRTRRLLRSGADLGPWQPGPRPGARRRCSGLTMQYSMILEDIVAIITEGGPGRSKFLDPPLAPVQPPFPRLRSNLNIRTTEIARYPFIINSKQVYVARYKTRMAQLNITNYVSYA
jgi:hypothetical protein